MNSSYTFLLLFSLICNVGFFMELAYRKYGHPEIARKVLHLTAGFCYALMLHALPSRYTLAMGCIFLVWMIIARRFRWMKLLDDKIARWYGEIYFLIGLVIVFFVHLSYRSFATPMIAIMTFADGLAPFGQFVLPIKIYKDKTWWGSSVFFLITLGILLMRFGFDVRFFLFAAIITAVECLTSKGWDNIAIPLTTFILLLSL